MDKVTERVRGEPFCRTGVPTSGLGFIKLLLRVELAGKSRRDKAHASANQRDVLTSHFSRIISQPT